MHKAVFDMTFLFITVIYRKKQNKQRDSANYLNYALGFVILKKEQSFRACRLSSASTGGGSQCDFVAMWGWSQASSCSCPVCPTFKGEKVRSSSHVVFHRLQKHTTTKLLSKSCSSMNYFNHYYIIPTGCAPGSAWPRASLFSVSCFVLFFAAPTCKHFYILHAFYCLIATTRSLVLLTVRQCCVQCWQLMLYLCHCSPHVCHLRDRWTCVTPDSLLNGELYVSLNKPCRRRLDERCPPPYQSMCVSLSAAEAWGTGSVF